MRKNKKIYCSCYILFLFVLYCFYNFIYANKPNAKQAGTDANVKEFEKIKKEIGIIEKLGNTIPLNLSFQTENNTSTTLQSIFNKDIITILVPVYYRCPHMCPLILKGLRHAVEQEKQYILGEDYQIVTFSINPKENFLEAHQKEKDIWDKIDIDNQQKEKALEGWHFLTTPNKNDIEQLTQSIGFQYKKLGSEYSHTATLVFLTSQGKITRYLYRMSYPKLDFRLAIVETLKGKLSSVKDKVLLFCFRYISSKRKYQVVAWKVMTIGVVVTTFIFTVFLGFFWNKERKRKKN